MKLWTGILHAVKTAILRPVIQPPSEEEIDDALARMPGRHDSGRVPKVESSPPVTRDKSTA